MGPKATDQSSLFKFRPVTAARWQDFEKLFGERGACGNCWCMYWRVQKIEFDRGKTGQNKLAIKKVIMDGLTPGLLAYKRREPIGWCSVAPREQFIKLEKSRILRPVDKLPVWSVSCLFISKPYRRQGLSARLLDAAAKFAFKKGAHIVEGYPHDLSGTERPDPFVWTGLLPAYIRTGFVEVARRSDTRPIMRRYAEKDI